MGRVRGRSLGFMGSVWISAFGVATALLGLLVATATAAKSWPDGVERIEIRSSLDGSIQPAMFAMPERSTGSARPLLVALHSWSSGYDQPLSALWAQEARSRNWVFIHPDFRGANTNPQAGGSETAIRDVLDAVDEARRRAKVDPRRIYLAGYSGGGHAALLVASKSSEIWAAVSVWSPITDLLAWHRESEARGFDRYVGDIEAICGGVPAPGSRAEQECFRRSPLSFLTAMKGLPLDLNTGIRDGHAPRVESGTVPISHTIRAFNLLADPRDRVPFGLLSALESEARVPAAQAFLGTDRSYGAHRVLFRRSSGPVRLTLFDGDHEVVHPAAVAWLERHQRAERR